jgi:hypothetical protein
VTTYAPATALLLRCRICLPGYANGGVRAVLGGQVSLKGAVACCGPQRTPPLPRQLSILSVSTLVPRGLTHPIPALFDQGG